VQQTNVRQCDYSITSSATASNLSDIVTNAAEVRRHAAELAALSARFVAQLGCLRGLSSFGTGLISWLLRGVAGSSAYNFTQRAGIFISTQSQQTRPAYLQCFRGRALLK
jgi:hypothetical protein